ncbi:MAG: MMPL family transporter [Planctomycetaceae bacterium]|jgi:predicted RND superfamily exporter protein|nr:MMPL family transporter [Planctomycetaceae bacterium]
MRNTFFSDHGFRIIFLVVFMLSFIGMGTNRTLKSNSNNVADWLPETFKETQEYKWFLKNFPYESFVVVSWEGCTMDDDRLEMFAQKLVPGRTIDNIGDWMTGAPPFVVEVEDGNGNSNGNETIPAPVSTNNIDKASKISPPNSAAKTTSTNAAANNTETETPPAYFKDVLTGPRLLRLFEERYTRSRFTLLTRAEILERLDGLLIGPDRTSADGKPLEIGKYPTAMIVTLHPQPNEKALRKVLAQIREIGRECGVEPVFPDDQRAILIKFASKTWSLLKDMTVGSPYNIDGIIMGGPPVDNVAVGLEGERTLYRLAGVCAVLGVTIALICLGSLRVTMFVFFTALISAGISLALVWATGSRCDAIMLSMPALVYVLAISGAIHIVNYYRDAIREKGIPGAAERAVTIAWYPCFMASFTTAIGLGSLYFSHLIPIMKFGFYSAIGVLCTLLLLFFYLPSLLHFFPAVEYLRRYLNQQKSPSDSILFTESGELSGELIEDTRILSFWRVVCKFIINHHFLVGLCCLGVMIYFAAGVFNIKTSVKMMRFYSPNAEIIAHYTALEEQLGPLVPMEVVLKFDNRRCPMTTLERYRFIDKVCKKLRAELPDDIGSAVSAVTFGPPPKTLGAEHSTTRRTRDYAINGQLDRHRHELKDYITIEGDLSLAPETPNYTEALKQLDITESDAALLQAAGLDSVRKIILAEDNTELSGISTEQLTKYKSKATEWEKKYGIDLWRISMRVWSLKRDIDYSLFINKVKNVVNPMIDELLAEQFPDEKFPVHALINPAERLGIWGKTAGWVTAKAKQISSIFTTNKQPPPPDTTPVQAVFTGMVPVVYKTQHELIAGLVDSLASAFILIGIVMALILRNAIAGFLAMLPNLFPVAVVFGFMGIIEFPVDVGTMMTASVAMGIAVDDTIHYLTWFRTAIDQGCTPREANQHAYERCATAMTQTTLIGGVGLSAFAFSTFTPTQMFGVMMLAMLSVALIGDLIFLPAILSGPAGKFFVPKKASMLDLPENFTPDMNKKINKNTNNNKTKKNIHNAKNNENGYD